MPQVQIEPGNVRKYVELTEAEWQSGVDYLSQAIVNWESQDDDRTWLRVFDPTPEQIQELEAVLS